MTSFSGISVLSGKFQKNENQNQKQNFDFGLNSSRTNNQTDTTSEGVFDWKKITNKKYGMYMLYKISSILLFQFFNI